MRSVAIHNLGCKVNSYEAESMEQMLTNAGYQIVPFDENVPADIYIINTCSVTNIADRKSRQMLHKAKRMNPDSIVIAAGCYVQADAEHVEKDEAVDLIIGNNKKINIVEAIEEYDKNHGNCILMEDLSVKQPYEELEINQVNEHTRAYIKIQDGCNQFCSYCIIPYTRGRIRSREMEDVVAEVSRLADKGYKEIVLTGIHLSSYGVDSGKGSLLEVIERLHAIEGIHRIRLGSLEPRIVTEEFAKRMGELDKVCPHFHLSLQSGCDKTLKAMNRKYTTKEYEAACNRLQKYLAQPAITTDVIVGFPGETEDDFEITKEFLKKIHFYEMHIFKFSRRKGTAADQLKDQIDEKVKSARSNTLIELEERMSLEYRKQYIGKSMDVLIEEVWKHDGTEYYCGYSKNYIRIIIPKQKLDTYMMQCNSDAVAAKNPTFLDDGDEMNCSVNSSAIINSIFKVHCKQLIEDKYMLGELEDKNL